MEHYHDQPAPETGDKLSRLFPDGSETFSAIVRGVITRCLAEVELGKAEMQERAEQLKENRSGILATKETQQAELDLSTSISPNAIILKELAGTLKALQRRSFAIEETDSPIK